MNTVETITIDPLQGPTQLLINLFPLLTWEAHMAVWAFFTFAFARTWGVQDFLTSVVVAALWPLLFAISAYMTWPLILLLLWATT